MSSRDINPLIKMATVAAVPDAAAAPAAPAPAQASTSTGFMNGNVIDGKAVAAKIREETAARVAELKAKYKRVGGDVGGFVGYCTRKTSVSASNCIRLIKQSESLPLVKSRAIMSCKRVAAFAFHTILADTGGATSYSTRAK